MTWYELDPARLVLERVRVSRKYPHFVLNRDKTLLLSWSGELRFMVGPITPEPLVLSIEYPESFPALYPHVNVIKPEIPSDEVGHKWHRWPISETICYIKPKDWHLGTT